MKLFAISPLFYILLTISCTFIAATAFADNGFWDENSSLTSSSASSDSFSSNLFSSKNVSASTNKQTINVSGSTTVSSVLNLLADRFEQRYKETRINIIGGGSSSALTAMLADSDTIGQMSRAMKAKERDAFIKHYGYEPVEFKIAVDALAVYINKNNPVKQLTTTQLADIFSQNTPHVNYWGDIKLAKLNSTDWKKQPIQIYSLPQSSGAYSLFNKRILNKAGYKVSIISQPTSSSVVQAVGVNPGAISFASSFFKTQRTHFVALEAKDGRFYQPVQPWISTFQYPLSRYLYLYINQKPGTAIAAKNKLFLQFLMSDGTQVLIKRAGFYSVSEKIRRQQLELLENN